MRLQDLPGYSHVLSLFTCHIYRRRFRAVIGLWLYLESYPRLLPYIWFLFVRPEVCPVEDHLTPTIRLSSDSTSRCTPLPLTNPSHCRADSGLSPYRTCAHRAHKYKATPHKCPFDSKKAFVRCCLKYCVVTTCKSLIIPNFLKPIISLRP